jgi:hypothetical protein
MTATLAMNYWTFALAGIFLKVFILKQAAGEALAFPTPKMHSPVSETLTLETKLKSVFLRFLFTREVVVVVVVLVDVVVGDEVVVVGDEVVVVGDEVVVVGDEDVVVGDEDVVVGDEDVVVEEVVVVLDVFGAAAGS